MTEIAHYQAGGELSVLAPAVAAPSNPAADLIQWAEAAKAAFSLARVLCDTPFVPEAFRGKPTEGSAAIMAGAEVGLSPLAALQAFDVIQGRATPRAITQRAVVQSRGHQMILVENTESQCVMKGRRLGDDEWQRITWTIDRARKLKLTSKPNWMNQPQAMLLARATGELARLIASDALLGIPYNAEELQDQEDSPAPAGGTRSVRRTRATVTPIASAAEPDLPVDGPPLPGEDEPADAVDEPPAEPITQPQLTKLHICLKEAGVTDRDRALEFFAETTGRWVESSKDLTKAEASQVIEALVQPDRPAAEPDPTLDPGWGEGR